MATVVKNKRLKAQSGISVKSKDSMSPFKPMPVMPSPYTPTKKASPRKDKREALNSLRKDQRTDRKVTRLEDRIDRIKLRNQPSYNENARITRSINPLRPLDIDDYRSSKNMKKKYELLKSGVGEAAQEALQKRKGGKVKAKTTMKKGGSVKSTYKKGGKVKKSK